MAKGSARAPTVSAPAAADFDAHAARPAADTASSRTALAIALAFFVTCYTAALNHAMWRDEWQPLVTARDTRSYAEFLEGVRWIGMNGFYSFVWLIEQAGLGTWFFKFVLIAIAAIGIYTFCLKAPFSTAQKILFAFGYFPFYEYGAILRNYGISLTASIIATSIIASRAMNPLAFGLCLAVMAQTHTFGLVLSLVFGPTFLYELHRRGKLQASWFLRPTSIAGLVVAVAGIVVAAIPIAETFFFAPEWAFAAATGGATRTDSHLVRFRESLVFPVRGWLPVPLFGAWDSQFLDPWPWSQVLVGAVILALALVTLARSRTALVFFGLGIIAFGGLFANVPWRSTRYHGHYYLLLVLALWLAGRLGRATAGHGSMGRIVERIQAAAMPLFTGLLVVHVVVNAIFTLQERLVPFSGSREAARIIRENEPPDVLVIGDIDAWMTPLSGCLGRPIYVASRRKLGSFVKVDATRRWLPLEPQELSAVIQERLAAEQRDVVLVTNYPVSMPPEVGTPLGVVDRSITDERYFIFRIRYRRATN